METHERFNTHFERFRERYKGWLTWSLHNRAIVLALFGLFVAGSSLLTLPSEEISSPTSIQAR